MPPHPDRSTSGCGGFFVLSLHLAAAAAQAVEISGERVPIEAALPGFLGDLCVPSRPNPMEYALDRPAP